MAVDVGARAMVPDDAPGGVDGVPRHGGRGCPTATPPPPYERQQLVWPRPRRHPLWRRDAIIAANNAVAAGAMPPEARGHYLRWLSYSNDHGEDVTPMLRTVGAAEQRSERTAAYWSAWLRRHGWLCVQHRARQDDQGRWWGRSNITRPMVPAAWQHQRAGKGRPTPQAPQNRPTSGSPLIGHRSPVRGEPGAGPPAPAPPAPPAPGDAARSLDDVRALLPERSGRRRAPPGRGCR